MSDDKLNKKYEYACAFGKTLALDNAKLRAQIKQLEDVLSKHTKRIVQLERELASPSPQVPLPFSKTDEWSAESMCFN
jgi:hypothetical protein